MWQPIATCPENTDVLLYQPRLEGEGGGWTMQSEGMLVGSIKRESGKRGEYLQIYPMLVSGWEMEVEMDKATHWMPLPATPE